MKEDREIEGSMHTGGFVSPELKKPTEIIDRLIFTAKRELEYDRSSASGQSQQAEDTFETKQHIVTPIKRLEKHGVRLYAEAGVHALRRTRDPNNPVTV